MKKVITAVALLLMVPTLVSAQNTDHQSRGLGYVFVGPATNQMGMTAGFGGEGYAYKGLGVGVELGTAGFDKSANGNPNWIGVGSADLSYHFFPKKIRGRAAPFVTGGCTFFFGQDTDTAGGNVTHGFNVGGGVDIFAAKHAGVRFDVRYNAHGGRILWASFPNLAQLSFVAFRVGLTFR
jgi:predicted small secreted protein